VTCILPVKTKRGQTSCGATHRQRLWAAAIPSANCWTRTLHVGHARAFRYVLSFAGTAWLQMRTSYSPVPWRSFFLTMVRQTSGTVNFLVLLFCFALAKLVSLPRQARRR